MNSIQLLKRFKRAGMGDVLSTALDVIEPVGAVGAQMLYIAQPVARLLGDRDGELRMLGQLIETPEGIAMLRAMLEYDESPSGEPTSTTDQPSDSSSS